MKRVNILGIVILSLLVLCLGLSMYTVKSSQRGVVSTFGKINPKVIKPGFNMKWPFIQSVTKESIQTKKFQLTTNAYTKDIQSTEVVLEVNYELKPSMVPMLLQQVGRQYEDKIILPILRGVVKDAFGNYNASDIVQNREVVRATIENEMHSQLETLNYFQNVRVQISNIDYDDNFERSIVEKQIAEQNALKAKNQTIEIEEKAKQTKIRAEADAEAIRIKAQALERNPKIVQYEAIQKWDGKLPVYTLGNSVPFINLN